ncbi:hypothetical protein, partial [Mitsuokella jalaludinii]|uniref:hypothetical protein n=1 Tax=Mitsuokella jalaludinii TaxID=187979 RepID=UPI0022E6DB51
LFSSSFGSCNPLPIKASGALAGAVSLSDLYYDTVYKMTCQQLFAKKIKKKAAYQTAFFH